MKRKIKMTDQLQCNHNDLVECIAFSKKNHLHLISDPCSSAML